MTLWGRSRRTIPGAILGCLIGIAACGTEAPERTDAPTASTGTAAMVERLGELAQGVDRRESPFANQARVEELVARGPAPGLQGRMTHKGQLGEQLLYAGRFAEATDTLTSLLAEIDAAGGVVPIEFRQTIERLRASGLYKWLEQEVCVEAGDVDRCLFPVQATEDEAVRDIADTTITAFLGLIESGGPTPDLVWLLNVSAMIAGRFPDAVPAELRLDADAPAAVDAASIFPNRAPDFGLDAEGHAGGAILDDFDRDGDLDALLSGWLLEDSLRYYENTGSGFVERTTEAGLRGLVGGLNMKHADFDNDGFLDVLILRGAWLSYGHPNSLLKGGAGGRFEDVTAEAGLLDALSSQTADWADFDGDGWVDLYIGNESARGRTTPNQLLRNNGDGTFTDVARFTGTDVVGFVKGVAWGDYDNDGDPDLYVSRLGQPNVLLRNDGPVEDGWRFTDVTESAGAAGPVWSFPVWFWDYDNDGWLDLYVSAYRARVGDVAAEYMGQAHSGETPTLYRNLGDGTFVDVAGEVGLDRIQYVMGANYGDIDSDGYPDFYVGTGDPDFEMAVPNRMFRNEAGAAFAEITAAGGFGHIQKGHAVSFGDADSDGDLDVLVNMGGATQADKARNAFFENPGHSSRWVNLRLEGVQSNRAAIGARIRAVVSEGGERRAIHAVVSGGSSFGANSLDVHLGLGNAERLDEVEIVWPGSGSVSRFEDVGMDAFYHVREGESAPTVDPQRPAAPGE